MKEIIITSSVLILCIMLIRVIFMGKISSRLQYALWILVALRLVIPASAQIYMAIGSIEEFRIMDLTKMAESRVGDVTEQLEQPVPLRFEMSMNGAAGKLAAEYILEKSDDLPAADGPTSVFYAGRIGFTWLDILRGIWAGGMVIVALWMIITNIIFTRKLHRERKEFVLPETLYENLPQDEESLEAKDGKRSKLIGRTKIYTVDGLASPCLYGVPFKEAVYLTQDITEDKNRLRHVLIHEMCHKKHGDSCWSILRSVLLIIYWMNPLVWVAAVLSKRDCELACDEEALLMLGEEERISYGETLLSIITRKGKLSDMACTATTMTGSGKSVKERIKHIADKPRVLGVTVAAVLVLVMIVSVLVFTKNPLFHATTWEGETTFTAGDMQITLPETIAGISGYEMNNDGDIVIYQIASGEEVGRFCEVSYGEAVLLVEQDREVIPIGDYGRNLYLKEYLTSFFYPDITTEHYYTPYDSTTHNYDSPESEGVPGTDSNSDDTTYIIEDETYNPSFTTEPGLPFFDEDGNIMGYDYGSGDYHIPPPQKSDWEVIPLSEEDLEAEIKHREDEIKRIEEELVLQAEQEAAREMQEQERMLQELIEQREEEIAALKQLLEEEIKLRTEGVLATEYTHIFEEGDELASIDDDTTYILEDEVTEESVNYLPNEEIVVREIPRNTAIECYIYVKGDYSGVKTQYLQELNYIDSVLRAVAEQVTVVESD